MSFRSFSRLSPILSKININHSTSKRTRTATIFSVKSTSPRTINTSSRNMATQAKSEAGQVISDVSQQEGGTFKGSTAAQMQSQITKQRNLEDAAAKVGSKLDSAPETVTSDDASLLHSREARVQGGPSKGDLASQAQSVAAANERGAPVNTNRTQGSGATADLTSAEQSQLDREANYVEAADKVGSKLATEPENVTKEEGDLLHSRKTKAFGATEKGGVASQAQSQAAKNAGDTA